MTKNRRELTLLLVFFPNEQVKLLLKIENVLNQKSKNFFFSLFPISIYLKASFWLFPVPIFILFFFFGIRNQCEVLSLRTHLFKLSNLLQFIDVPKKSNRKNEMLSIAMPSFI